MDRQKIIAFSRAAKTYDENAWLQCQMWDELFRCLRFLKPNHNYIIDIGMGSGKHTYELTDFYPAALTVGLDIASGMVKYAADRKILSSNGPFILQADLNEMPFKEHSFDIAVSNVVYQGIADLLKAFLDVKRILKPKGFFCLSLLTKNTLRELHLSFERAYKKIVGTALPTVYEHPADSAVLSALKKARFSIVKVMRFKRRPAYKSTYEILEWLKNIGANHHYDNWIQGIGGRAVLKELDEIYRERYSSNGTIFATFEGLIINARGKD